MCLGQHFAMAEMGVILSLLRWTTDYFQDKGVSEPRASAEVLLAHKANVNATDRKNWTPLHNAANQGFNSVVELLLDYVLRLEFRKTSLLWPYLFLYYLGMMGMIGWSVAIPTLTAQSENLLCAGGAEYDEKLGAALRFSW